MSPSQLQNSDIIQRIQEEPNLFAKAQLIREAKEGYDIPVTLIAQKLHCSAASVCHLERLLRLPDTVIDGYYAQLLSQTHLFIISRLDNPVAITEAYERILTDNLTTAQTEELVRTKKFGIDTAGNRVDDTTTSQIKKQFRDLNRDTSVKVVQSRVKAKIIVEVKGDLNKTTEFLEKLAALSVTSTYTDS